MKENHKPQIVLASASERRRMLMKEHGFSFIAVTPDVDESDCSRSVKDTVVTNAKLKNKWAEAKFPDSTIISADTAIEFQGKLIGKPRSLEAAREQLRRFSGSTHIVYTGIACSFPGHSIYTDVSRSDVTFLPLPEDVIDKYFSLVNPLDKAGSYDIGSYGELIVKAYTGSLSNIIGLPMELLNPFLAKHGYRQ